MDYYFNTILHSDFSSAQERVTNALKEEGFSIANSMNMQEIFKEKLHVDFKKYIILGVCNPRYALAAIQAEEKVGAVLPCNVLVIEKEEGTVEVVAINPVASMMAIDNKGLKILAGEVTQKLKQVIESL